MNKYEIMIIIPPTEPIETVEKLIKSTFRDVISIEKMEQTDLAYPIKNSKVATYILALVNSEPHSQEVNEFERKANITKAIWRHMTINLSTEKGIGKPNTPSRRYARFGQQDGQRKYSGPRRSRREYSKTKENSNKQ